MTAYEMRISDWSSDVCSSDLADVVIVKTNDDESHATIVVRADDQTLLDALIDDLQVHGANRIAQSEAVTAVADQDGVLPAAFHPTTNLDTEVLLGGTWHMVEIGRAACRESRCKNVSITGVAVSLNKKKNNN